MISLPDVGDVFGGIGVFSSPAALGDSFLDLFCPCVEHHDD
jgi:hypothetical protein